jgi:peptide/nickel transport system permease protein
MVRYFLARILALIPILIIIAVVAFVLLRLIPGDPASAMLPDEATIEEIESMRIQLGYYDPMYVQFFRYVVTIATFNFGDSLYFRIPVTEVISMKMEPTFFLALYSQILAIIVGIPVGIWAAANRGSFLDQLLMTTSLVTLSVPSFYLGLVLMLFVSVDLGLLPVYGYVSITEDPLLSIKHLVLPILTLGLSIAGVIARMTRSSILEVLSLDYIKTAYAKGVSTSTILFKHALGNAMIPTLAIIALSFSALLGGSAVIEVVFAIPGLGSAMVDSVHRRDYPMIQALLILFAGINVLIHLLVDFIYAFLDPRIRYN